MARFIIDIKEELGVTILIVEHDMGVVMDISDWVVVINFGLKIAEGAPTDIVRNPLVIQAYLGEREAPRLRPGRPPHRKEPFLKEYPETLPDSWPGTKTARGSNRPEGKRPGDLGGSFLEPVL